MRTEAPPLRVGGSDQLHIAFYLPAFHPIPENDAWWGPGFTEWVNVVTARSRFRNHYQPHIPADLGFYDLRLGESRQAQAQLAASHGIDAFCYYHYWFGGRRLLERPFDEVLASGEPRFPFCLAWANENWTRRWDGGDQTVLMKQDYDLHERDHAEWLVSAFSDSRYVRVNEKPLFLIYRASALPNPLRTTELLRETAREVGLPGVYLVRVESFPNEHTDPTALGFDAAVAFSPDWSLIPSRGVARAAADRIGKAVRLTSRQSGACRIWSYESLMNATLGAQPAPYIRFPCVVPGWDNSPRRQGEAFVLRGSNPDLYGEWVRQASELAPMAEGGQSLVFVNAWNEWGEGAHLEPCRRFGRAYLQAHLSGRERARIPDATRALP